MNAVPAGASPSSAVRFGSFVFDPVTGELTRQGRRVALQDQPARVLGLLATRAGQLVTRDELRQALWAEDTFVEFETAIAVARARAKASSALACWLSIAFSPTCTPWPHIRTAIFPRQVARGHVSLNRRCGWSSRR